MQPVPLVCRPAASPLATPCRFSVPDDRYVAFINRRQPPRRYPSYPPRWR
ncbi:hypothetical protein KCP73_23165 [Salmonella enterica subsp. enterica]|nr:hypothetical protein KCP73_23165 [Salmonella enterica subsp. enterica]